MIFVIRLIKAFFITLGVIFFGLIILASYFWMADPLELKPLFYSTDTGSKATSTPMDLANQSGDSSDIATTTNNQNQSPVLNNAQAEALERVGIDSSALPSDITDEQMSCFNEQLGEERVDEIIAGAVPTPLELIKASSCL
jgi:hypothetical protein